MEIVILLLTIGIIGGCYVYTQDKKSREKAAAERQKQRDYERERFKFQRDEELQQEAIKRELESLIEYMLRDWNSAIYADKVETPGDGVFTYEFENGDFLWYQRGTLRWKRGEYTLGLSYRARFSAIFNRLVEIINKGNTDTRGKRRTYSTTSGTKKADNSPNRKYQTLMETIRLRKEGLAKMKKSDPDYTSLLNELRAAERVAASMKPN